MARKISDFEQIALDYVICPTCMRGAGRWCVVLGTRRETTVMHTPRLDPVHIAYGTGYDDRGRENR